MSDLTFSTKKSLHPAIKVTIEGKVYQSKKFTHPLLLTMEPLTEKIDKVGGNWDSLCKWMKLVFGIEKKPLEVLEEDEVFSIYMEVKAELLIRYRNTMTKYVKKVKIDEIADGIQKTIEKVIDIEKTAEEIEKNDSGPGKKS